MYGLISPIRDQQQVFAKYWPYFRAFINAPSMVLDHAIGQCQRVEMT
jgi:hypothetical protein